MPAIADVLTGEKGLGEVQRLLTPASIRPALQGMVEQPDALGACHLRRAKFKPGRKLTAYFDVAFDNSSHQPRGGITRSIAVTWTLRAWQQKDLAPDEGPLGREIKRRGLAEPFHRLINAQPDANMHVQVAPLDLQFPHLARLTDPVYLRHLLNDYAAEKTNWRVKPIRYRPRQRHVLRYDSCRDLRNIEQTGVQTFCERQTLFAKLYCKGSRRHFCSLTHQLADWLSETAPHTAVLRPLAYLAADNTILYAQAQGEPLSENPGGTKRAVERIFSRKLWQTGSALNALHRAPDRLTSGLPTLDIASELKAINRTCEHIQALLPEVGQTICSLLAQAADWYADLPQEAPTFIHGDFKADHVLVAKDRLTLIDFDSCALADPAFDIGKFLADLAWWYGDARPATLKQARNAFLAGYGLPPNHPRLQRAHVWEALIGIKIIAHRVRIFDTRWATRTSAAVRRVQERM